MDNTLQEYIDKEYIHGTWFQTLVPVSQEIAWMRNFLEEQKRKGEKFFPAEKYIFRAFSRPFEQVRVVIIGQDPYPTAAHAQGFSFSVAPEVSPLPRSLMNIFRELCEDIGCDMPINGDLTPWVEQGVMLLNRVLTVGAGRIGSHSGIGWEEITLCAFKGLVRRKIPLVVILWGKQASELMAYVGSVPTFVSAHPSPLSAWRGFFGSRPFSRANEALMRLGSETIDWKLPSLLRDFDES